MIFPKPFIQIGKKIIYFHQTQDEKDELRQLAMERKYRADLLKQQRKEVKYLARAIPTWLAKMGHAYWYKKSEREPMKGFFNPIKINQVQIGEDAYFLRVDTKRLPRGVMVAHLKDHDVVETLSHACGSTVGVHETATGFWYRVDTAYGRGNIPLFVGYSEMLKMMPDDAPPLAFPLGLGENSRPSIGDMAKMMSLLVGGTKNGGKSNTVNVMICTFIRRNPPHKLRVFLTDLKGGLEFADYDGIPHLGGDVFWLERGGQIVTVAKNYRPSPQEKLNPPLGQKTLTDPEPVIPMLKYVEAEMNRRLELMVHKARNIDVFNKRYPDHALSYWIVIIDELATMMYDKRYSGEAELIQAEISRKGRAAGIFPVFATQTPDGKVVPRQIANNMDSRLAFRCGDGASSGILLGNGQYDAEKLPPIPGRLIWKWGGEKITLQAPFIEDTTINHIIREVKAGHYADPREIELAQKAKFIFEFALNHLNGECQTNDLYSMVKVEGIKQSEVKSILNTYQVKDDGTPEILLNNELYVLAPSIRAKRIPRWLIPATDWQNRKHPHPEYNYDLVCRVSDIEKEAPQVWGKIQNSPSLEKNDEIDNLAILEIKNLSDLPNEPSTNGAIDHTPMELLTIEPASQAANGNGASSHHAPTQELTQAGDYPDWLK